MIFIIEKLDKLDKMVDAINNLKINYAKYYEPSTATASEAQGDLTRNLETVTHTSNSNFEQELLIYRTILVLPPSMDLWIGRGTVSNILASWTLLTYATKEFIAKAAL